MFRCTTIMGLVIAGSTLCAQEPKKSDEPSQPALTKELARRVKAEQDARNALIEYQKEHPPVANMPVTSTFHALATKVEELDAENLVWMKGIVAKHGWPGRSLVGKAGAGNAWLLVQHADKDRDFQEQCLNKMQALPKGEVEPRNLAYLTDRVLVGRGKKQRFGTQTVIKDGKAVTSPIEDEDKVDERRKAIGLEPLADYLKTIEAMYTKPKK